MRQKSPIDFLRDGGWSAHKFIAHALMVLSDPGVKSCCTIEIYKSVVYFKIGNQLLLKAYVHRGGHSRDYLTFTDAKGQEVKIFHCSEPPRKVLDFVLQYLGGPRSEPALDDARLEPTT